MNHTGPNFEFDWRDDPASSALLAPEPSITESIAEPPRILLAEDSAEMRALIDLHLRREGYEVVQCADGASLVEHLAWLFLPKIRRSRIDLVISDIRMPGFTGMEVLDGIHECRQRPPIILITAFGDEETHERALRLGAAAVFDKPFSMPRLLDTVRDTLRPPPARAS